MCKESWCRHTTCRHHDDCDKRQDVGRAVLSSAAETTWLRTEDDPGEYLVIEAAGETVKLTRKEVGVLAELFRREPQYYLDPFAEIDRCIPSRKRKDYF